MISYSLYFLRLIYRGRKSASRSASRLPAAAAATPTGPGMLPSEAIRPRSSSRWRCCACATCCEQKPLQKLGLACLFAGVLVAMKDVATGVAAASGNRALGIAGLLVAQASTAFANVAYERQLREPGSDKWVRNVQLTAMITLWLAVSTGVRTAAILGSGSALPSTAALVDAFLAPWVWLVVALKAASAVLIALTISAGGNVLYAISKPWPVVFATLATCLMLGKVPSLGFISGIALSVAGITLYYTNKES
jgi:hypothetical protein